MPLEPELQPEETLYLHAVHQASKDGAPFAIAASDSALFLLGKKTFAVSDPYYLRRVPKHEVELVTIRRVRPFGMWLLAALMSASGLALLLMMAAPLLRGEETRVSGYPLALLVVGLVIPFEIRGRVGLVVTMAKTYRWTPPIVVGGEARRTISELFDTIVEGLARAGIPCRDERRPVVPPGSP